MRRSNGTNQEIGFIFSALSNTVQSAGLKVKALSEEISTAKEIVTENCLYNSPVIPGIKATGTKTANSTKVVAIIGPETCSIALVTASLMGNCSSFKIRSTFSITIMASSTTIPMASTKPNKVMVLIE